MPVSADDQGLSVPFAGHPDERLGHRGIVRHRQAAGFQTSLAGQGRALFGQSLGRLVRGRFRLEGGTHVEGGGRHLQHSFGERRRLEGAARFPYDQHEGGARGEEAGRLTQGPLGAGRAVETNDDGT